MIQTARIQHAERWAFKRVSSHDKPLCHVPLRAADAAHSARNIALWNSYLPAACVRTMVASGWDYTT